MTTPETLSGQMAALSQASKVSPRFYLDGARAFLTDLVARRNSIDVSAFPRKEGGFTRNLIASGEGLSAWAMVWSPGARTPIHDHHCSCCFGVLAGSIEEKWFRAITAEQAVVTDQQTRRTGFVGCMMPSGPNIHQMANETGEDAVSIHIYGYDHELHTSSIDRVYRLAAD